MSWGYIDRLGHKVIEPRFDWTGPFGSGRAPVDIKGRIGFIDEKGAVVIPPKFGDNTTGFEDGLAVVEMNDGKFRFVDPNGELMPGAYDYAEPFDDGFALVVNNGRRSYVTKDGEELVGGFDDSNSFRCGVAAVFIDDDWWFIDRCGHFLFGPFDQADYFSHGLAIVVRKNVRYLLRRSGEMAQFPLQGRWLAVAHHDRIAFGGEKIGYADLDGKIVVPPTFEGFSSFRDLRAAVQVESKWGVIDTNGNWIVRPRFNSASRYSEKLCAVEENGKYIYLSTDGVKAITTDADIACDFYEGKAAIGYD